jgi:hypothetical protein
MKIKFSKYNGAGNDFIVIDDRKNNIEYNPSLIKKLCNRNFGIGGDGLILIKESKSTDFEIFHYTQMEILDLFVGMDQDVVYHLLITIKLLARKLYLMHLMVHIMQK